MNPSTVSPGPQSRRDAATIAQPFKVGNGCGFGFGWSTRPEGTAESAAHFDIVLELGRPVAIISPLALTHAQINALYCLLPERAVLDHELSRRWNVTHVLADPEWAQQQKKRVPMLRPHAGIISLTFAKTL